MVKLYKKGSLVVTSCGYLGKSLCIITVSQLVNGAKVAHISYDCFENSVGLGRWSLAVVMNKFLLKVE